MFVMASASDVDYDLFWVIWHVLCSTQLTGVKTCSRLYIVIKKEFDSNMVMIKKHHS